MLLGTELFALLYEENTSTLNAPNPNRIVKLTFRPLN